MLDTSYIPSLTEFMIMSILCCRLRQKSNDISVNLFDADDLPRTPCILLSHSNLNIFGFFCMQYLTNQQIHKWLESLLFRDCLASGDINTPRSLLRLITNLTQKILLHLYYMRCVTNGTIKVYVLFAL